MGFYQFIEPREPQDFARRPGDERHPLAKNHGPDWRAVLQIKDHPFAEQDDSAFYEFFGDVPFNAAPDLTAHRQVTEGLS